VTALAKLFLVAILLIGLPLLSAGAVRATWDEMLELPPRTSYVLHAPFSWLAFVFGCALVLAWVLPFIVQAIRGRCEEELPRPGRHRFPWWGWVGLVAGATWWILAWTRFSWFSVLQRHTFSPLWFSYILVANALAHRRTGRCLMLRRPRFFLVLFPVSAVFWWFFEYLNRFVQNWRYVEAHVGPAGELLSRPLAFAAAEYVVYATLAFSTVLPAVLSTRELLLSFRVLGRFRSFAPICFPHPKRAAWSVLLLTGLGLACIGWLPDYLFPLLWVSPLLIVVSIQVLWGGRHVFSDIPRGDWRGVVAVATAALICGLFWEMWNYHSMAKWVYDVPFVHALPVFEMPILGYAGYLPFGLECAVLGDMLGSTDRS